jgi:hypothetical protein
MRRSYQIKAEQARNERFKTISVRLTPEEYKTFLLVASRHDMTPAGYVRRQIRDAISALAPL